MFYISNLGKILYVSLLLFLVVCLCFNFQGRMIEFYMSNPKTIYILIGYVSFSLLHQRISSLRSNPRYIIANYLQNGLYPHTCLDILFLINHRFYTQGTHSHPHP